MFCILLEAFLEVKRLQETSVTQEDNQQSMAVMQEMIDSLTRDKLADAFKLDDLNKQLTSKENSLEELQKQLSTFNEISIENEALKRQLKRLSQENDDLLIQMQSLESKTLSGSEETILKLKSEVHELSKQNEEKDYENKSLQDIMENNSAKFKKLIQENSDLKESLQSRDDVTPIDQVKIKYEKCIKKLKVYREKIQDISEKFKLLKADREILILTTKDYSESVTKWQKEIACASVRMMERIRESNEKLRLKDEEIESLRREISNQKASSDVHGSNEVHITSLEAEIQQLKEAVKARDKSLSEERDAQKKLKQAVKKTSLLDLEMEAYERTLDEINKKLEAKKIEVIELEKTVKMQMDTMDSLKSQIDSLEANLDSEKCHSAELKKNLDTQLNLLRKTEHDRTEANLQLELTNKSYETLKLENSENMLEMAQALSDLEKRHQVLQHERDDLLRNISSLENDVDKFKKLSSSHEDEIENLRAEFASYKIRAQGVLRQSHTKDCSKEQEMQDEIISLQKTIESFKETNFKIMNELESFKKNFEDIVEDKSHLQSRCKNLLEALEKQSDEVLEDSRKRNQQHEESIKAYQLQIDTLNAFYKKKIQEIEERNSCKMSELQVKMSKLEKASTPITSVFEPHLFQLRNLEDQQKMNILMMDREEAEGSEDQSSQSSTFHPQPRRKISKGRELMPLDELLNSSFDDTSNEVNEVNEETISNFSSPSEALEQTKVKLSMEENRITHLTALLADSEKDLARMQQMNEMLKEEVRRQQRNFDREEHIQNSEYLKNIVIKFLTLSNGDERLRLIPVINTILKLSSEENTRLQNACKTGILSGLWSK